VYAPDRWDGLLEAALAEGLTVEALEAAGLVLPRRNQREGERGHYDRFRDRVMFPIADVRGRVVAFGARALGDAEPKYLNSPETILFHKGKVLYGLDRARDEVQKQGRLSVMEGYMDVIMAHQHGIRTAVACLGTAFTPDHAALMRRFADRIELVYDADQAGRRAADRALEVLLAENVEGFVAVLPEGVDPCDLLVEKGAEALQQVLDSAREVFEHLLKEAAARHDLSTVGGATAASDAILKAVVKVPHDVKRGLMIRRTAEVLGVEEARVRSRARELGDRDPSRRRKPSPVSKPAPAPPPSDGPPLPEEPFPEDMADPGMGPVEEWDDPRSAPSRELLLVEAALTGPKLAGRMATEAPPDSFSSRTLARIARAVGATAREDGSADPAACAAAVDADGLADVVMDLVTRGAEKPEDVLRGQFEDCLRGQSLERRLDEARRRFSQARREGDQEEEDRWLGALNRLQAERSASRRAGQRRE
jgi:DNA primase